MSVIGYVSVAEADAYIKTHYLKNDDLYTSWFALDEDSKIVLLNKSFQAIELLPFTGRKLDPQQPNAFPRWPNKEVPNAVQWAQIENAVSKSNTSNEEDAKYYERLWTYGVESYSIGNLSEKTSAGAYSVGGAQSTGIISATATRLLRPFLGGGYRM